MHGLVRSTDRLDRCPGQAHVFEILDELRDRIGEPYGLQIRKVLRDQRSTTIPTTDDIDDADVLVDDNYLGRRVASRRNVTRRPVVVLAPFFPLQFNGCAFQRSWTPVSG